MNFNTPEAGATYRAHVQSIFAALRLPVQVPRDQEGVLVTANNDSWCDWLTINQFTMDIEVNSDYQLAYFHQKKFFKQPSRDNWDVAQVSMRLRVCCWHGIVLMIADTSTCNSTFLQKKWARFNFRYPFGLLYCRQRLCQVIHLACVPHPKMEHNMAGWSPEKWDRLIELLEEVHLLCLRRDSSLKIARIEDAQKQNSRIDEGLDTMKIFQDKDIIVNCCKYNRMLAPFRLDLEQQPKEKGRFDKPSVNTEKVKAL